MVGIAERIGLDLEQFRADLASPEVEKQVRADFAEGQSIGVTGTPSFLINGTPVVGAQPTEVFEQVIEDAAHCVDGSVDGRRIGTIADFTAFSFYSTKNLATGEGGMVTLGSADRADWMRVAALHGLSRHAWARYAPGSTAQYDVVMPGFKYNMMDLQAALGLAQLARLGQMQARRARLWDRYDAGLAHLPLVRPAAVPEGWTHARHLYAVIVDPALCGWTRDGLQAALGREGIGTSVHFRALHLHPYYAERLSLARGMFPNAEYHSDNSLSLPFWSGMPFDDVDRVVETLDRLMSAGA